MRGNKSLRIIKKLWIKNHTLMIKTKTQYKTKARLSIHNFIFQQGKPKLYILIHCNIQVRQHVNYKDYWCLIYRTDIEPNSKTFIFLLKFLARKFLFMKIKCTNRNKRLQIWPITEKNLESILEEIIFGKI